MKIPEEIDDFLRKLVGWIIIIVGIILLICAKYDYDKHVVKDAIK